MDIYKFFPETILLHYPIRILQHLKAQWTMYVFFPTKCFLFHTFISLSSQNIQVFQKPRAKFKYPAE